MVKSNISSEKNLGELRVGEAGRVSRVSLPADYEQRLAELGILPGARIEIVHVAPLGDPIAIECNGRRMGMRKCDARGILLDYGCTMAD
jgi:Fe2+ transport system protein FeoA